MLEQRSRAPRVVIAGGGALGASLASKLEAHWQVLEVSRTAKRNAYQGDGPGRWSWPAELGAIAETEQAFASAEAVVFLARTVKPPARLTQASTTDIDVLMADTVARAATRAGVRRLVTVAEDAEDPTVAQLRRGPVPVRVLEGGAQDTVAALSQLLEERGPDRIAGGGVAPNRSETGTRPGVMSVQRYPRPAGWSAHDIAFGYAEWLAEAMPLVATERVADVVQIKALRTKLLTLVKAHGRSDEDSCWLEVSDGALVDDRRRARFEFRVLLGGHEVMAVLDNFDPRLPWPVYRATQAIAHASVMRRFGRWLAKQAPKSAMAPLPNQQPSR